MSEAIIAKILEDARSQVNTALEEGGKAAAARIAEARNEAAILLEKSMNETSLLRDEIIRRRVSVANLEVRKLMLAAKMKALDMIFAKAGDDILAMPKDKYLAVIRGMLASAEDGDAVMTAVRDKNVITEAFIQKYAAEKSVKLTLSSDCADIAGGIILSSGKVDKNLSLEVEMKALRERLESEAAVRLFG